jgi:hypothetical protein
MMAAQRGVLSGTAKAPRFSLSVNVGTLMWMVLRNKFLIVGSIQLAVGS